MSSESSVARIAFNGVQMCFEKVDPKSVWENTDATEENICGTLEREQADVLPGIQRHRHHITMYPTRAELATLLPLAGLAESPAGTFTASDTLPSFDLQIDRVAEAHLYDDSYVDVFILSGQRGRKPLKVQMQIVSKEEEDTSFSASPATAQAPIAFIDGNITSGGFNFMSADRLFDRFALVLNHKVASRFNNNETADYIVPTDHDYSLGISIPYTATHKDIYDAFTSATRHEGAAGTLQFSRGGLDTLITMGNLKWQANPPAIPGKPEDIRQDIYLQIFKDGSTPSIVITNDATP